MSFRVELLIGARPLARAGSLARKLTRCSGSPWRRRRMESVLSLRFREVLAEM